MRKRITALLLSLAFAVASVGSTLAQESVTGEQIIHESAVSVAAALSEEEAGAPAKEQAMVAAEEPPEETQAEETQAEETQAEVTDESPGEIRTEVAEEPPEEIRAEVTDESPEEIQAEAADNSPEEIQAEGTAESFILDIEEVASAEDMAAGNQEIVIDETVMEPLRESGIAELADFSAFSLFSNTEYTTSYGEQLEGESKTVYDKMEAACKELEENWEAYVGEDETLTSITYDLTEKVQYNLTKDEYDKRETEKPAGYTEVLPLLKAPLQAAYDAYVFDHPGAFWMGTPVIKSFRISYSAIGGEAENGYTATVLGATIGIRENYSGFVAKIPNYNSAVQEAFAEIQDGLAEGASRWAVLLAVHDYLCDTLTYDRAYSTYGSTSEQYKYIHSAAGAFLDTEHKVVCDGYAKAFKILADKFGIDCAVVPGMAGESHAWNCVKMEDGNWYLVDVTWDDTNDIKTCRYFLVGSQTIPSGTTVPIGEARTAYSSFSKTDYSASFASPLLYAAQYHTEHSWTNYVSNGDATCTEDSTKTAVCDVAGCYESDTIPDEGSRLGHSWTHYVSNGDATCTADGTKTAVCDREGCAETNTIPDEGSRLGHSWTHYVSNGDATCLADGTKTAVCDHVGCTVTNTVTDVGSKLLATIALNVKRIPLKVGQSTTKVTVSGLAPGDSVKGWSSNKPAVASVNAKTGKITAKKVGTARITVKLQSGKTASVTVKVRKSTVKTRKLSGVSKKLTLKKKAKFRLKPVCTPITSQQKITYSSSDKKVATVSKNGLIKAKKAGKTTITIKSGCKTVKCTVTVK